MIGVLVTFSLDQSFDASPLRAIARRARGKFEGTPGLRSKAFTIDETQRRAVNFYIWDDETAARGLFTPEVVSNIAQIYGVTPTLTILDIAEIVDNAH